MKHKTPHNILEAINLDVGYTTRKSVTKVVSQLSFSCHSTELVGIIGVNGIGKSTLLKTLGAVLSPLSGELLLHGKPLHEFSTKDLALQIGLVLTDSPATKNFSVAELVALGRHPYTNWLGSLSSADRVIIEDAIAKVGLREQYHKKCHELSDGQLQKALLARALAQDTPLLLLDEPTTHLDLYHKVQLLQLLQSIAHNAQKTIVFTTHEINLAIQLCDSILILDGADNPFGTPSELIRQKRFDRLFPSDTISFDAKTGAYKVRT